jgi:hypothetical protein
MTTYQGNGTPEPQPRRSWLGRLIDAIVGERVTVPYTNPGPLSRRQGMSDPILLPAEGDTFDFGVRPVFTWHSEGLTTQELDSWIARLSSKARRTLSDTAADVARSFPPHRARELEARLNQDLQDRSWSHTEDRVTLRYEVRVRVEPDERVREQMRPFWEKRIRMECEHELDRRRAELVDELTQKWSSILEKLHEDPLTSHAARLGEEQFAKVFGEFVADRKQGIQQIIELLREAVKQQNTLGLGPSEYTRSWDAALEALLRQYGLDGERSARDAA